MNWFNNLPGAGTCAAATKYSTALRKVQIAKEQLEKNELRARVDEMFLIADVLGVWSIQDVKKAIGRGALVLTPSGDVHVRGEWIGTLKGSSSQGWQAAFASNDGLLEKICTTYTAKAAALGAVFEARAKSILGYYSDDLRQGA